MKFSFGFFIKQCHRELLIQLRQPKRLGNALLFFVMMIVFFPLAMPAQNDLLQQIAPGLLWIALLFIFLQLSERFFQQDFEDGVLDQWLVSGYALSLWVLAKLCVYWLLIIVPVLALCPLIGLIFGFSKMMTAALLLSMIVSTPCMLALTTLAAAFGTGRIQKGFLTGLILLPLTLPVMIFGSAIITASGHNNPISGFIALLLAFSIVSWALLPFAIAAVIRVGVGE